MIQWMVEWPTWQLTRIAGIAAYLALFGGMSLGILYGYPFLKGASKISVYRWHSRLTVAGTAIALLHAAVLVIDTYTPFTWGELLLPFTAHDHPVLYGIGSIALYGMLLLILTTDLRPRLKRPLWLAIHMLAYPMFAAALLHGLLAGTDSSLGVVQGMYAVTGGATLLLFCGRLIPRKPGARAEVLPGPRRPDGSRRHQASRGSDAS
ncbi:ferric reductase-like transmembrane domain-containing protein [Paenibacillus sp. D51F]